MLILLALLACTPPDDDKDPGEDSGDTDTSAGLCVTQPARCDQDADGYRPADGDCDDADASVNPGAAELCDGADQNCDDVIDEGFDADADGVTSCGGDCDDDDDGIHPGAEDPCDGGDEDCDGEEDEDGDVDADGLSACDGDCDDRSASIGPGATETPYDGVDQDCDGRDLADVDGDGLDSVFVGGDDCDDGDVSTGTLPTAPDPSVLAGSLSASDADVILGGTATGDRFGASIARVPDLDGDGVDEILIGAPEGERAYLYSGATIVASRGLVLQTTDARTELYGEDGDGAFGIDVSPAGDVDGDGTEDVLVGAYRVDDSGYDHLGKAYLFDGPDLLAATRIGSDDADLTFMGGYEEVSAGYAVAPAGDPDGDGWADFLITGPGDGPDDTYGGPGVMIFECPGARIHNTHGETVLWDVSHEECQQYQLLSDIWSGPNSLAGGVDLSRDGIADWAYGLTGYSDHGLAGVAFGSATTLVQSDVLGFPDDFTMQGATDGDDVGSAIDLGCDVDGDGAPDLVVGAQGVAVGAIRPGGGYVVSGVDVATGGELAPGASLARLYGESDAGMAGAAVACLGDVDGDGRDDVLFGAPDADAAYLASGADLAGDRWLACGGARVEGTGGGFGSAVASLGDLDGDGYGDFAVGAPDGGAGAVYVFFGP